MMELTVQLVREIARKAKKAGRKRKRKYVMLTIPQAMALRRYLSDLARQRAIG